MGDKKCMTIVVEYDNEADMPVIKANQPVLGGRIVGLAWDDALVELHNKAERLQILESLIRGYGFEDEFDELVEALSEL